MSNITHVPPEQMREVLTSLVQVLQHYPDTPIGFAATDWQGERVDPASDAVAAIDLRGAIARVSGRNAAVRDWLMEVCNELSLLRPMRINFEPENLAAAKSLAEFLKKVEKVTS